MIIGLFPNPGKERVKEALSRAVEYLTRNNVEFYIEDSGAAETGFSRYALPGVELCAKAGCALTFGGDGTVVKYARLLSAAGIPLCGVNLGRVGFLNDIELPEIETALNEIVHGRYTISERMMLKTEIIRGSEPVFSEIALNDAVISKIGLSRLLRLSVFLRNELVETYPADGIIIATPTGSTGYSLSANGPIIHPDVRALMITPICPHLLHSRSIVLSAEEVISVSYSPASAEAILTLDGQNDFRLEQSDIVRISKAPIGAKFIELESGKPFFRTVREKLHVR